MEFDSEKNKVIGIVGHRLKGDSVRIKVIGFINSKSRNVFLTEAEIVEIFPQTGNIFEPGFFINYNYKEGELIQFKVKEIEISRPDGDIYRISSDNNSKLNLFGYRIFKIENFEMNISTVNLNKLRLLDKDENYSHTFFGIFEDKIIGKLKIIDGKIEPEKGHFIRFWNKENCNIFEFKNEQYLLHHPDENYKLIDTMDGKAAFNWFREKLEISNRDVLLYLNTKTNWKNDLPGILINQNEDETEINKIRLRRIVNNLDNHNLLITDIKELVKTSEKLEKAFIASLEKHKIELRQECADEIEELKKGKEIEKKRLDGLLSKISIEIAHKNKELSDIIEVINSSNSKIEIINANKERILSDFSIIHEVLGKRASTERVEDQIQEESFVMEAVSASQNTTPITQRDKFLARLKYFVNQQNINSSQANKLIPIFASCQGVFMQKIELGLAFIEATGNSKYIIQQVEPDWLHFKDLWRNGLEVIWKSSYENPDILHFLILEDINLSSPECYMRPLLDCMNGIRKHIPFAKTAYPNNLRILATKISSEEPKIGLPLFQQTFKNWGAVGFIGDTKKPSDQTVSFVDGYIDTETLKSFKLDDFELKVDSMGLSFEYEKLFDSVE